MNGRRRRGWAWGQWSLYTLAGLAGAFLALPIGALVVRAVLDGSLLRAASARVVADALTLSLVTTSISLVVTVVLGLPLAIVMARRPFRGVSLVEALVDLPIVLPPSVAGLALLIVLGRRGLLGGALESAGIVIPFTTAAVIFAQVFISAPFFIRAARIGIAAVDRDLEDAGRVDGASELQVFRYLTMPLAARGLASGLVMSWARSLGEFGATIMFAGSLEGSTQTLPLVVYNQFEGGDLDLSLAAAAILVMAAAGVLVAVRLLRRGRSTDLASV